MLHKDHDGKGSVEKKNAGRELKRLGANTN
jgi:hypothetical protein